MLSFALIIRNHYKVTCRPTHPCPHPCENQSELSCDILQPPKHIMATQQHARPNDGTTESSSSDEAGGVNQNAASGTAKPAPSAAAAATSKKPNIFQRLWQKLDLDLITVMTMFKASLPPTIAIAFYQSDAVAGVYETLGYLVAVTSVLGMCIMPRGMFVQTM